MAGSQHRSESGRFSELCRHCLSLGFQGATDAHEFFVLEIGSCDVFVTRPGDLVAKKVKTYGPGSAFGELALLYAAPRAATVTTTAPCKVWVAERRVVATIKRHFAENVAAVNLELLDKVPMFGCLTDAHKQLLAGALEQVRSSQQVDYGMSGIHCPAYTPSLNWHSARRTGVCTPGAQRGSHSQA